MAVFAGGCGVFYFAIGIGEAFSGGDEYGLMWISVIVGITPGIIGGLIAWWAFRKGKAE